MPEPLDLNWQNAAELTPPPFRLAPAPITDGIEQPTWCSCGFHRATTKRPLCPSCLDDRSKGGVVSEWDGWESDPEWLDEEPARCELDHPDGGVCLRRLLRDGSCPDHVKGEAS